MEANTGRCSARLTPQVPQDTWRQAARQSTLDVEQNLAYLSANETKPAINSKQTRHHNGFASLGNKSFGSKTQHPGFGSQVRKSLGCLWWSPLCCLTPPGWSSRSSMRRCWSLLLVHGHGSSAHVCCKLSGKPPGICVATRPHYWLWGKVRDQRENLEHRSHLISWIKPTAVVAWQWWLLQDIQVAMKLKMCPKAFGCVANQSGEVKQVDHSVQSPFWTQFCSVTDSKFKPCSDRLEFPTIEVNELLTPCGILDFCIS